MSAAEIIEQIKALPLEERREVFEFVHHAASAEKEPAVNYADDASADAAMDRVFEKHAEVLRRLAQ